MKCVNCSNNALFEYKVTQLKSFLYCDTHLPKFLDARKKAGLLTLTNVFSEEKEKALEILSLEPAQVEESVEEPVVEEETKPKKKAAKKKAE
jgi:hypothetical protein